MSKKAQPPADENPSDEIAAISEKQKSRGSTLRSISEYEEQKRLKKDIDDMYNWF